MASGRLGSTSPTRGSLRSATGAVCSGLLTQRLFLERYCQFQLCARNFASSVALYVMMDFSSLQNRGDAVMVKFAYSAILVALSTTVAGAQSPAPRVVAPAPAVRVLTSVPADNLTVTHWYKQSVYDPSDNKIGEVTDVLVDREGKIGVFIVGVGGFVGVGE